MFWCNWHAYIVRQRNLSLHAFHSRDGGIVLRLLSVVVQQHQGDHRRQKALCNCIRIQLWIDYVQHALVYQWLIDIVMRVKSYLERSWGHLARFALVARHSGQGTAVARESGLQYCSIHGFSNFRSPSTLFWSRLTSMSHARAAAQPQWEKG